MSSQDNEFAELGLEPELIGCLSDLGYEAPTSIQRRAIPAMIQGNDLLCQAATGTGKTAAFALPILNRMAADHDSGKTTLPTALVLTPTRELCMQVAEALHRYGRPYRVHTLPVFGGQPIGRQAGSLKRGVDIVVATPGRAMDLIDRRLLKLDAINTVVLDEADEMLDMGFAEDIDTILASAPDERQTVMFSATMPKRIMRIAGRHLTDPERIEIPREVVPAGEEPSITQTAYIVARPYKAAALSRILDVEMPTAALVFCRTRAEVDGLTETLNARGYRAEALHGGMDQNQRDRVMGRLRSGNAELLVATDVAARGLDVEQLTHVFNFNVPSAPEAYVHRIGRVGRAGRAGAAITFAEPREGRQLNAIERSTKQKIHIGTLPTPDDLRATRLEVTRAVLERVCRDGDLDQYRGVLGSLSQDFDIDRIALAAIKLAHVTAMGDSDEEEIPQPGLAGRRNDKRRGDRRRDDRHRDDRQRGDRQRGDRQRDDRHRDDRQRGDNRYDDRNRADRRRDERQREDRPRDDRPREDRQRPGKGKKGRPEGGMKRVHVGLGKDDGIRARDLVDAISNETRLHGSDVGSVVVSQHFSTLEVPRDAAKHVVKELSRTRFRGRKVKVRLDRH